MFTIGITCIYTYHFVYLFVWAWSSFPDINECVIPLHNCDDNATCLNFIPGFSCTCATGFTGSGEVCRDIDECALGVRGCGSNQDCRNLVGSSECVCSSGYVGKVYLWLSYPGTSPHYNHDLSMKLSEPYREKKNSKSDFNLGIALSRTGVFHCWWMMQWIPV